MAAVFELFLDNVNGVAAGSLEVPVASPVLLVSIGAVLSCQRIAFGV
jgi:hypothetical protein